jgi:hypothetical protein
VNLPDEVQENLKKKPIKNETPDYSRHWRDLRWSGLVGPGDACIGLRAATAEKETE